MIQFNALPRSVAFEVLDFNIVKKSHNRRRYPAISVKAAQP
jgi:hypothetical protein